MLILGIFFIIFCVCGTIIYTQWEWVEEKISPLVESFNFNQEVSNIKKQFEKKEEKALYDRATLSDIKRKLDKKNIESQRKIYQDKVNAYKYQGELDIYKKQEDIRNYRIDINSSVDDIMKQVDDLKKMLLK